MLRPGRNTTARWRCIKSAVQRPGIRRPFHDSRRRHFRPATFTRIDQALIQPLGNWVLSIGPLGLLRWSFGTFLAHHLFTSYFFSYNTTWGISMLPTLNSAGDGVLISKYYRRGRGVQIGDLVSYVHPADREVHAVKRVIGLEGDFVTMGPAYVDDNENPVALANEGKMIQIPPGHCWVVGDNLKHSRDSRGFGPLPLALIRGKVIARWASWVNWEWLNNPLQDARVDDYDVD